MLVRDWSGGTVAVASGANALSRGKDIRSGDWQRSLTRQGSTCHSSV